MKIFRCIKAIIVATPFTSALAAELPAPKIQINSIRSRDEISIVFSQAVVDWTAETGVPLEGAAAPTMTPTTACRWEWHNRSELVCTLSGEQRLQRATRYQIDVPPITSAEGKPFTPAQKIFETQRPSLLSPRVEWKTPTQAQLQIRFNDEMRDESLIGRIKLQDKQGTQSWLLDLQPDASSRYAYRATLPSGLLPDTAYDLAMADGVMATVGDLAALPTVLSKAVMTPAALAYLGMQCRTGDYWDDTRPEIQIKSRRCDPGKGLILWFSEHLDPSSLQKIKQRFSADSARDLTPRAEALSSRASSNFAGVELIGLPSEVSQRINLPELRDIYARILSPAEFFLRTEAHAPVLAVKHVNADVGSGEAVTIVLRSINQKRMKLALELMGEGGYQIRDFDVDVPDYEKNKWLEWPIDLRDYIDNFQGLIRGHVWRNASRESGSFLIQRSDIRLALHRLDDRIDLWAVGKADLQALDAANIRIYRGWELQTPLAEAVTDGQGYAQLVLPKQDRASAPPSDRLWARIQVRDALSFVAISDYQTGQWHVADERSGPQAHVRDGQYLQWGISNKRIYNPGERVDYKFFLRRKDKQGLRCDTTDTRSYYLGVFDHDGNVVASQGPFKLDPYCAAAGHVELAENLSHGVYSVVVRDHELHRDDDDVSEYAAQNDEVRGQFFIEIANPHPPAVNVTVMADKSVWHSWDGPLNLDAKAEYFSGGPLRDAPMMAKSNFFVPDEFDPRHLRYPLFRFEVFDADQRVEMYAEQSTQAVSDNEGSIQQSVPVPPWLPGYALVDTEVGVRASDGQSYEGSSAATPFIGTDRYAGLRLKTLFARAGKPLQAEVLALNEQFDAMADMPVQVSLYTRVADSEYGAESAARGERVAQCEVLSTLLPTECAVQAEQAGSYELVASLQDSSGRLHEASIWVRVYPQSGWDWGSEQPELQLHLNKAAYHIGDTLQVLVANPYPAGRALLTLEREKILRSEWRDLPEGESSFAVVIDESMRNGFSLRLHAFRSQSGLPEKADEANINVNVLAPGIASASLRLDKSQYKPGEKVKLKVELSKRKKRSVVITAVDTALLKLLSDYRSYFNPDHGEFLRVYRSWESGSRAEEFGWLSRTAHPQWLQYLPTLMQEVDKLSDHRPRSVVPSSSAVSADPVYGPEAPNDDFERITVTGSRIMRTDVEGRAPAVVLSREQTQKQKWRAKVRQLFRQNAYWLADGQSDDQGQLTTEFVLPDNLTSWTLMAISFDADDDFTFSETEFVARLPIETRVTGPEQAVVGDRIGVSATLRNAEDKSKNVQAKLSLSIGDAVDHAQPTALRLHGFEEKALTRQLTTPSAGKNQTVRWLVQAQDKKESDATAGELRLREPVIARQLQMTRMLDGLQHDEIHFKRPADSYDGNAQLSLRSANLLTGVAETARYMRDYPHRCWEQRSSHLLVHVFASSLLKDKDTENLQGEMDDWLQQSQGFQAPNGGFSYWKPDNDYVDAYLSLYTALSIQWLRELGWTGGEQTESKLQTYLHTWWQNLQSAPVKTSPEWSAMAIYALATDKLNAQAVMERLFAARASLSNESLSWLLLALQKHGADGEQGHVVYTQIAERARERGGVLSYRDQDTYDWHWLGSTQRRQCLTSLALASEAEHVTAAYQWLRGAQVQRDENGVFGNTQDNALCLHAAWKLAQQMPAANAMPALAWRWNTQAQQTLTESTMTLPLQADNKLQLVSTKKSAQWLDLTLNYRGDARKLSGKQLGFGLRRSYDVFRNGKWRPLVNSAAQVGEWLRVSLEINAPKTYSQVALSDPLPGGVVAVDADHDATVPVHMLGSLNSSAEFYEKQFHDGHALFYADYLWAGNYRVQYYAKVTVHGRYQALPARIEAMYHPSWYGTSDNAILDIAMPKSGR